MKSENLSKTLEGIKEFGKLERILAIFCLLIPLLLILFDAGPIRESISSYYDMELSQVYYFPLTVASMMFVVNGVIKKKRAYNTYLGIMLACVILFSAEGNTELLHGLCAIAFFGGNAVVIILFSSKKERWFKILMVVVIFLSMVFCFLFHWFSLFWAEWISFAIIATHYLLESWGVID